MHSARRRARLHPQDHRSSKLDEHWMQQLHHIQPALVGTTWFKKLLDVDWSTPPTDGQYFKWDDASQKLIPATIASSGYTGDAPLMISKFWHYSMNASTYQAPGTRGGNGVRILTPIFLGTGTLDRIGCVITNSGTVGRTVRLGIYNSDATGWPTSVLLDAGTVSGSTGANTLNTITISQAVTKGLYWLCACPQGTGATLPGIGAPGDASTTSFTPYSQGIWYETTNMYTSAGAASGGGNTPPQVAVGQNGLCESNDVGTPVTGALTAFPAAGTTVGPVNTPQGAVVRVA